MCFAFAILDRSALHKPLVDLLRYYVEGISHRNQSYWHTAPHIGKLLLLIVHGPR